MHSTLNLKGVNNNSITIINIKAYVGKRNDAKMCVLSKEGVKTYKKTFAGPLLVRISEF